MLAAGILSAAGAIGTVAGWTDSEYAASPLSAGSFTLASRTTEVAFAPHPPGSPATLSIGTARLFPGESVAGWMQLQATGSVGGTVVLSAVALVPDVPAGSPGVSLRDALVVRVSATTSADTAPPPCTVDTPGTSSTGLLTVPSLPAQTLDAAGATTVTYCIVLTLPVDAPNAAQGGIVVPQWTFTGSTG